ncbi:hypothetical protein RB2973 [Rhodopirellula baltica SH 1]|uniref:Uncharacterized protein n=1 Tax=Rhodopirellula baltica (strain DSM 10527 / NCIMB 13988 / SH1) TaxID=243090 RepID=Q7UUZ3_RHOBA|nr:hypothetical protein RB2973 [Rhodopirellula baltica SH 1]
MVGSRWAITELQVRSLQATRGENCSLLGPPSKPSANSRGVPP